MKSSACQKPADLDIVDFHAHILPGADHGSDSVKTSLEQLALAKKYSANRILATPHFYPNVHTVSSFISLRSEAALALNSSTSQNMPQIKLGAEVLICEGLQRLPDLDKLCFLGTNYLMLELPFFNFSEEYVDVVSSILDSGYNVILAHADRYPAAYIEQFIDCGVKSLQINALSLLSFFKPRHIFRWLEKGLVTMLGSDIHGANKSVYSGFLKSKSKISEFLPYIKKTSDYIWNQIESI